MNILATRAGCEVFMDIFSMPWPKELNCSSLPESNDTSVCIGYMEAHEPKKIDGRLQFGTHP